MKQNYPSLPGVADGSLFIGAAINDISKFPTFDIRVSGILFHLSPHQYFIQYDVSVNQFILGIRSSNKVILSLSTHLGYD